MEKEVIIRRLLQKNSSGLTISDLVRKSKLSRSTIRTILARLEGAKKISYRQIGMAKVYTLKKALE